MLSALEVLLRERSVSRAAQFAGLSQPAMSNALARMRNAFEDPLIVRGRKGMVLTDRGATLLEQLSELMPQVSALSRPAVFDPAETDAVFRMAATDHAGLVLLPKILSRFTEEAPNATLQVTTVLGRQADLDQLAAAGIDLQIGWFVGLPPHWRARKLFDETLVMMGASSNAAFSKPLDLEAFLALKHVVLAPDQRSTRNLAEAALARQGLTRQIGAFVSSFAVMPYIVQASDMVAILPSRIARQFEFLPGLTIQAPPFAFDEFAVTLAWQPRVHQDPAHRWLREIIIQAAAEPG